MDPDQKRFWQNESWKYFERNYQGKDLSALAPNRFLESFVTTHRDRLQANSILDFGCGAGSNLRWLQSLLGAERSVGVESSQKTVDSLSRSFPGCEFRTADGSSLPFKSGEFDLVLVRGVLMYVERDYILQTLGELVRVCGKYLLVGDFYPPEPYSAIYHHDPAYRTFKIDYDPVLSGARILTRIAHETDMESDPWQSVSLALYRKNSLEAAFPIRSREDFDVRNG